MNGRIIPTSAGAVIIKTNQSVPPPTQEAVRREPSDELEQDEDPEDAEEPTGVYQEMAAFHEIVSWAQESLPDDSADAHLKGVHEWIRFSEKVAAFFSNCP